MTTVVGSGIAAQRLSTDVGLRLLENSPATVFGLAVLIPPLTCLTDPSGTIAILRAAER